MPEVITDNLDLWSSALLTKSTAGRGSNGKLEAYGIKKLRELILELAVRGKLVPQDPNDEPANVLLKRIQTEKAKLIAEGKIKKDKPLAPITEDEKPFELPLGWKWVRLNELLSKIGAGSTPLGGKQVYVNEGVPFLRSQNVWDEGLKLDDVAFITPETHQKMLGTHVCAGDLLFNITGASIGRCAIVPKSFETGNVSQHVTIIRSASGEILNFLHLVLISKHVQQTVMDVQVGVSREGLSIGKLGQFIIPMPPLSEQHRIVAKVDELMALCDQLEQQQTHSIEAHQTLVASLLGTLTRVESQQEFSEAWARIASHFDTLFTTEASIDQLKQTILQLAVMGKLVPQVPNDEPALALLAQIAEQKTELAKNGKFRGSTSVAPMDSEDGDFQAPPSWLWVRFGEIMINRDGERIPVSKEEREAKSKVYDYYGASGVIDKIDGYLFDKPLLLIGEDGANLINRSTPIAFIARGKYWVNNHAHVLDGISEEFLRYIELHINAINLEKYVTGSAQPKMNQAKMNTIPIALPPLAEQHRIVSKVDELMALCDSLKARIKDAQAIQLHLADAIVEQAVC